MLEKLPFYPIINVVTRDSQRSYKVSFLLLIGFIVSLSLILINIGTSPINVMPWDMLVQIDSAWRVLYGQVPNVNFTPIIPPISILLTTFGMKVVPPSASAIVYGNILLFVILTFWSWFIASSRLSAANTFLFALFMGVLVVAPRALGDSVRGTTYAMIYNRQGWVLLSMLYVELFIFHRKNMPPQETKDGLSSGILLALLLFSKLTFFAMGLGAILIRCLFFRPAVKWFVVSLSSFLLLAVLMQVLLPLNLSSYISEMRLLTPVYGSNRLKNSLLPVTIGNWKSILILIIPLPLLINNIKDRLRKIWLLVTVAFVILTSIILCSSSAQVKEIPLFLVVVIIYLEYLPENFQFSDISTNKILKITYLYNLVVIIPLLFGIIFIKDIGSIAYSAMWNRSQLSSLPELQKIKSPFLASFVIPASPIIRSFSAEPGNSYPQEVNDGLMLLRKHISKDSRVFTLAFSNPFSFALELPPPSGGVTNWLADFSFNTKYYPNPEKAFKGANMIMVPKKGNNMATVIMMKDIYKDYLAQHFIEKDSSEYWTLLVKSPDISSK